MITHRLKVTENRTIERLDHKPIVSKSNGADFIQFTFDNPGEWNIAGVLVVYMFNGTPYGSCVIDKDSNGNPLAITERDGAWQLTVPVPYQCITSEGYLYTGLSLFRTDVDTSASTDTTPHIIAKISTALLSQPIQILKNGGLDEIDVAASPNDDLLVRMKLFVENFSTEWMENVDGKFEDLDKVINGDSETGGGLIADIATNANNILGLQERIDELDDDIDALDIIVNGTEEIIGDDGSVEQEKVTGLVELQKKDAANIESIQSTAKVEHNWVEHELTDLKEKDDSLETVTDNLVKGQESNATMLEEVATTLDEQKQRVAALQSTVENPVFDATFSDTSTSAVQNKVLTNLLNGMPTETVFAAVADTDTARFYIGQEQLKYDSSTGEISNTDPIYIGLVAFSTDSFKATIADRNRMLLQLNPSPTFESLAVSDDISIEENSELVPNTKWVFNFSTLQNPCPFTYSGSMKLTQIDLSTSNQVAFILENLTMLASYGPNLFGLTPYEFDGAQITSSRFLFLLHGWMTFRFDLKELNNLGVQEVVIQNYFKSKVFDTSNYQENKTPFPYWKWSTSKGIASTLPDAVFYFRKSDNSDFTELEIENITKNISVLVYFNGFIEPHSFLKS